MIPLTPHARLTDMTPPEITDLFCTVQVVERMLARKFFAASEPLHVGGSFNVALQDGREAGQTVPHVHVHVFPRPMLREGEEGAPGTQGDEVYQRMAAEEGNVGGALWDREVGRRPVQGGGFGRVDDGERRPRGEEDMRAEADGYRDVLREMGIGV